ncbi:hypothetical protein P691DRAFT_758079 [Macrolepiota fuliginosa MF-IS2]|uniref:ABM domain-containing protein n=1 Tax=Macrolepiota fuliginosa MF-IS2 TaxID=1400762 RepID=A0A9P5XGK4_9AGAR|nr:hypothetical protein P691DRAFT_758079 [Macrolepiota fuliginosa MF-IS2]
MPVVEICSFAASEAFRKDPHLAHPAYELIRLQKGLQYIYEGVGIEEPNTVWLLLVWDSYDDHKALIDNEELYPKVTEALGKCIGGDFIMRHVEFNEITRIALTSPVSEIVALELRDKTSAERKEALKKVMVDMIEHCHTAPRAKDHPPFAYGETKESAGSFYFLGGWTSVEYHTECVEDPEGIKEHVRRIGELTTYKVSHVHVREYGLRRG